MHQEYKYEKRKWEIYCSFGLVQIETIRKWFLIKIHLHSPLYFRLVSYNDMLPTVPREETLLVIPLHIKVLRHNEKRKNQNK